MTDDNSDQATESVSKWFMADIARLQSELDAAKAENARLRKALTWYDSQSDDCRDDSAWMMGRLGRSPNEALIIDKGKRAHDAVAEQEERDRALVDSVANGKTDD